MAGYGLNSKPFIKEFPPTKWGGGPDWNTATHWKFYRWRSGLSNWRFYILIHIIVVQVNRPPIEFPLPNYMFLQKCLCCPCIFGSRQNLSLCSACFPVALPALQTLRFPILQRLPVRNDTYFQWILHIMIWAFQNHAGVHILATFLIWHQHCQKVAAHKD